MILTGPNEVLEARLEVRLSQEEAAELVRVRPEVWEAWESPTWADQYEQISHSAWKQFLILTHVLRDKDSKYRVREEVLRDL